MTFPKDVGNGHKKTGGVPALRGFRKQFLYTLRRILNSSTEVIYPERYEDFEQAKKIHDCLIHTYGKYNYNLIDVPFDTVEKRTDFIVNHLNI